MENIALELYVIIAACYYVQIIPNFRIHFSVTRSSPRFYKNAPNKSYIQHAIHSKVLYSIHIVPEKLSCNLELFFYPVTFSNNEIIIM